jgi:hypothetical protein
VQERLKKVSILCYQQTIYQLTCAVCRAEGNDLLGVLFRWAGLVGAVADTVAKVGLSAVAGDVALGASQLSAGDLDHISDTHLL